MLSRASEGFASLRRYLENLRRGVLPDPTSEAFTDVYTWLDELRRHYNDKVVVADTVADSDDAGGGTDNYEAFKDAAAQAAALGGRRIIIPPGAHRLSQKVTITTPGTLVSSFGMGNLGVIGDNPCRIVCDSGAGGFLFGSGSGSSGVRDLTLINVGNKTAGEDNGLEFTNNRCYVANVNIRGFGQHGVYLGATAHHFTATHLICQRNAAAGVKADANTGLWLHYNSTDNDKGMWLNGGYHDVVHPHFSADDTNYVDVDVGHNAFHAVYCEYSTAPATIVAVDAAATHGHWDEVLADATTTNFTFPVGWTVNRRGALQARAFVPTGTADDFTTTQTQVTGTTWTDTGISQTVTTGPAGRMIIHYGGRLNIDNASYYAQLSPVVTESSEGDGFAADADRAAQTNSTSDITVTNHESVTGLTAYTDHTVKLQLRANNASGTATVDDTKMTVVPG